MSEEKQELTRSGFPVKGLWPKKERRERDWRMAWIQTPSGKKFAPFGPPEPEEIDIGDIAHALSLTCRWGGACRRFYSVAQHSVLVSENVPERLALAGLLHDAAEAYLGDIPGPLKATPVFEAYRREEDALLLEIFERFDTSPLTSEDQKIVHEIDVAMAATEARDLMSGLSDYYAKRTIETIPSLTLFRAGEIWTPTKARAKFLTRYQELKSR